MKTPPQCQPTHRALSTYIPDLKPFTSPSHLSYSARKECQISRTGLGRSRPRFVSPSPEYRHIIQSDWNEQSSTKKDSDASTSLPNSRDRRYVSLVFTSASSVYQALASLVSGGMQMTLVYRFCSDMRCVYSTLCRKPCSPELPDHSGTTFANGKFPAPVNANNRTGP